MSSKSSPGDPCDFDHAERERPGSRLPSEKVLEVLALDLELNARGIESWLTAEGKSAK